MTFEGKTAFITGGASGIGRAFASLLASQGAQVCIADVNQDAAAKTVEEINAQAGAKLAKAFHCDVTSFKSTLDAFAAAREFSNQQRVDIVLSNAGTLDLAQPAFAAEEVPQDLNKFYQTATEPNLKCLEIGLLGSLYVTRIALAQFRGQGADAEGVKGRIVLAGSEAGIIHMAGDPIYGVTKASMISLARGLGVRTASEGIYVNAYAPNLIETAILPEAAFTGSKERDTLTQPPQLAEAATKIFLDPKSRISGHVLGAVGNEFELRAVPAYFSPDAEKNAEIFWPPEETKKALQVPEGTKFRAL